MGQKQPLSAGEQLLTFGAIVGLVAAVMTWFTVSVRCTALCLGLNPTSTQTIPGTAGWGQLYFMAMVGCLGVVGARMLGPPGSLLSKADAAWRWSLGLALAAAVALLLAWVAEAMTVRNSSLNASYFTSSVRTAPGLFVGVIAVAITAIGALLSMNATRSSPLHTASPASLRPVPRRQPVPWSQPRYGALPPPPPPPLALPKPQQLPDWWVPLPPPPPSANDPGN